MSIFPFFHQHDAMDCGATCLRMIAKYYGKNYSLETLREKTYITREGVSLLGISEAAEKIGFRTMGLHISLEILNDAPLPCIVHWKQEHFVVVYDIKLKKQRGRKKEEDFSMGSVTGYVRVADPAHGLIKYTIEEFLSNWISNRKDGKDEGIALLFEPSPEFHSIEDEKPDKTKLKFIFQYLRL
jgi:ATP-binding cassette subfamily B protein